MPTVTWYREGIRIVVERSVAFTGWTGASIKTALVTASYVPSQAHTSYADISSFEISGGDYSTGGITLSSKTIATSTNQLRLDAADVTWSSIPIKPRYAVVYDSTNVTASQRTLLGYMSLGNLKGQRLRIKWPSTGVLTLTVEDAAGFP
jgi:hypothetical protein